VAVEPGQTLFRAEDMLQLAREEGLTATKRLIFDWVSLGLLDRPKRRGLGRGNGSIAGWTFPQACLFLDLLRLRQRSENPIKHVAPLANVPVAGWLWLGDASGVPVLQVRRALATWCGQHRTQKKPAAATVRKIAREIVAQLENPHAARRDRDALIKHLETTIRERTFDPEQTRVLVERVFDPHEHGLELGPREAPFNVDATVTLMHAHALAFLNLETFSDQDFEDARLVYQHTRRGYAEAQPTLAHDRKGSPIRFEEPTVQSIVDRSCRELLLILGMGRLATERHAELAAEAKAALTTERRQTINS
jgi:hypothetical protein